MSSFCHMTVYLERALVPFKKKGCFGVFLKPQNTTQCTTPVKTDNCTENYFIITQYSILCLLWIFHKAHILLWCRDFKL